MQFFAFITLATLSIQMLMPIDSHQLSEQSQLELEKYKALLAAEAEKYKADVEAETIRINIKAEVDKIFYKNLPDAVFCSTMPILVLGCIAGLVVSLLQQE